jgi:PAS domain S-box-containing protein
MKEIVRVKLENEMDLILAHKRAMKLCELTGFSLIAQTSIATAVSEISRCAIEFGKNAELILGIDTSMGKKQLKAIIRDSVDFSPKCADALSYAKRLIDDVETVKALKEVQIILKMQLAFSGTLTENKIDSYITYFKQEPPLSAYDELRRKNLLLQELAEKLKESENDYRILTDSLPLMMFSVNNRGLITYTNKWLSDFLGALPKELNSNAWKNFVHPTEFSSFSRELGKAIQRQLPFNGQYRFRERSSGDFVWHIISIIPLKNEKDFIMRWIGFIVDINAQKVVEQTLKDNRLLKDMQQQLFDHQEELQKKVIELNRSNYELEQFAHLASHDLQEPLRKLFFYADVLKKKYSDALDDSGVNLLNNMTLSASRMKELISDLLNYSQLHQQKLAFEEVDLNEIFHEIRRDLDLSIKDKGAKIEVDHAPKIIGNSLRLRQLFSNLFSNALKYSRSDVPPYICVKVQVVDDQVLIQVKDNGIGFEEQYREKIFGLFERLHTRSEYPGTGIGLSICKRIAELHDGTITADSKLGEYSVFEVSLPLNKNEFVSHE